MTISERQTLLRKHRGALRCAWSAWVHHSTLLLPVGIVDLFWQLDLLLFAGWDQKRLQQADEQLQEIVFLSDLAADREEHMNLLVLLLYVLQVFGA